MKPHVWRSASVLWTVLLAVFLLTGCARHPAGEPAGAEGLSESDEVAFLLEQSFGFVDDPAPVGYVEDVGGRIVAESGRGDIEYRFKILDTQFPNALALPDGQIFVSRGLLVLVNTEDELAGILAHEIAHVEEHHARERDNLALVTSPIRVGAGIAGWATGLVIPGLGDAIIDLGDSTTGLFLAPYSREQEREADRVGQSLAAAAGYRPEGLVNLLDTMADAEALDPENVHEASWFDTHPATIERVGDTRKHAETLIPAARPASARDRSGVLVALQGLVVGADPGKGFFSDNWFVHPELAFVIAFPPGWEGVNSSDSVAAKMPDEEILVMLTPMGPGTDPMKGAKVTSRVLEEDVASDAQLLTVNGLQAARNLGRLMDADGNVRKAELTWIAHGGLIYQVMGVAAPEQFDAVANLMRKSAHSFRPLSDRERSQILVVRVHVVKGRQGETIAELAKRVETPWTAEVISVVNRKPVTEPLEAGELIKVGIPENYAPEDYVPSLPDVFH
jgi:predicted Zn-dependent protease